MNHGQAASLVVKDGQGRILLRIGFRVPERMEEIAIGCGDGVGGWAAPLGTEPLQGPFQFEILTRSLP